METNDATLKEVYLNILKAYDHFIHNNRATPLEEDVKIIGDVFLSIYAFECGKSGIEHEKWYFINPNICVMIMNTKINNINIIIRTTKSAPDKIECKFKCNSNSLNIQIKNKNTDYVNKRYHTKVNNELAYAISKYIKANMTDEVRCWLILDNKITGVM